MPILKVFALSKKIYFYIINGKLHEKNLNVIKYFFVLNVTVGCYFFFTFCQNGFKHFLLLCDLQSDKLLLINFFPSEFREIFKLPMTKIYFRYRHFNENVSVREGDTKRQIVREPLHIYRKDSVFLKYKFTIMKA